jgi:copper chaperone NosL
MTRHASAFALTLLLLSAACTVPGPRPVVLGSEACAHCHMTVADDRFIAQLVTSTGKVLIYDDPGCLATALRDGVVADDQIRSLWVTDYLDPATLLDAEEAWFVQSDAVHTPMASGLVAVPSRTQADSLAAALSGTVVRWDAVRRDGDHRH